MEDRPATQEEIDAAIVACLRVFAARGRALREARERAQKQVQGQVTITPNDAEHEVERDAEK